MDSRLVSKLVAVNLWPLMRGAGFVTATARRAWRPWEGGVDVVEVEAKSDFLAAWAGVHLSYGLHSPVPQDRPYRKRERVILDGQRMPEEHECDLRLGFRYFGENPHEGVEQAVGWMTDTCLTWFDRFHDVNEVLRTLREDQDGVVEETFGMGRLDSLHRRDLLAAVAAHAAG